MPTVYFDEDVADNYELVPAPVGGKQIVVLGAVLMGEGNTAVTLLSSGVPITKHRIVDGGGVAWFFRDSSLACAPDANLVLTMPDSVPVYGHIEYVIK